MGVGAVEVEPEVLPHELTVDQEARRAFGGEAHERRERLYLQARPEDQEQTAVGKVGAHALAKASGQLLAKKGNGRLDEAALPLAQRA